jgi:hypothetical protein
MGAVAAASPELRDDALSIDREAKCADNDDDHDSNQLIVLNLLIDFVTDSSFQADIGSHADAKQLLHDIASKLGVALPTGVYEDFSTIDLASLLDTIASRNSVNTLRKPCAELAKRVQTASQDNSLDMKAIDLVIGVVTNIMKTSLVGGMVSYFVSYYSNWTNKEHEQKYVAWSKTSARLGIKPGDFVNGKDWMSVEKHCRQVLASMVCCANADVRRASIGAVLGAIQDMDFTPGCLEFASFGRLLTDCHLHTAARDAKNQVILRDFADLGGYNVAVTLMRRMLAVGPDDHQADRLAGVCSAIWVAWSTLDQPTATDQPGEPGRLSKYQRMLLDAGVVEAVMDCVARSKNCVTLQYAWGLVGVFMREAGHEVVKPAYIERFGPDSWEGYVSKF